MEKAAAPMIAAAPKALESLRILDTPQFEQFKIKATSPGKDLHARVTAQTAHLDGMLMKVYILSF
jgi:hypothetical protein